MQQAIREPGEPLDGDLASAWQPHTGFDLGGVRIHRDAAAIRSAMMIRANGYALGPHIVLGSRGHSPKTPQAKTLISHEVGHVIASGGRSQSIQRDEGDDALDAGRTHEDDDAPIRITITAPPHVWFTNLDGRYLVRVQGGYVAYRLYDYSVEDTIALERARRRPNIANPQLPADQFVDALEDGAGMALLPEARSALLSRDSLSLLPYGEDFYAIALAEPQLIRWFGASQWAAMLRRPAGIRSPGRADHAAIRTTTGSRDGEPGGRRAAEGRIVPAAMHPARRALADRPELSRLYLAMMEHFSALQITPELTAQAADGLSAAELRAIVGDNAERSMLTDLFTQGWSEFRTAGGSQVIRYEPLAERLLEQYQRGNLVVRANLLVVGHGSPERTILGLAHRRSGLLLYDDLGLPMRGLTGMAWRDVAFLGYDPPISRSDAGADSELAAALHWHDSDQLVANLFLQATGVDDVVMIREAAQAAFNNSQRVADAVAQYLDAEIRRVLGPTLAFIAIFMLGHAFARLLLRSANPVAMAVGAALEGLLQLAGYVMGLQFLLQTWEILIQASFHLSRVRNDEHGQPTRLSLMHIENAAQPIAALIANVAMAMGTAALGAALRRVRAGASRGVIGDPNAGLREFIGDESGGQTADVDPGASGALPPGTGEVGPTEAAPQSESTVATRLRPTWRGALRARLLAAVMRGVVEAAPATAGTGGGSTGSPVEPIRPSVSRVARVAPVAPVAPGAPGATVAPMVAADVSSPAAPEVAAPEVDTSATPTAPATVEPASPASPATPTPTSVTAVAPAAAPDVWVNTRSGVFHRQGSQWYGNTAQGEYMSEAQATARGFTAAGAPRALPPTGVYAVERPGRGPARIVQRAWLGVRQVRAGLERLMMGAAEYGVEGLEDHERAHSMGAGLGIESGEGIRLASELVNQVLQRRGIEGFLRQLRDIAISANERIHLTTETMTQPRTLRLASIHYIVEVAEGDRMITLFEAAIEVRRTGQARCGVRLPGSDTYTWGPWFSD